MARECCLFNAAVFGVHAIAPPRLGSLGRRLRIGGTCIAWRDVASEPRASLDTAILNVVNIH